MRIDLDDLEHDCRGAPVASCPAEHPMMMPTHACATTTLALIARIRELEGAYGRALNAWHGATRYDVEAGRALLEKGVVVPLPRFCEFPPDGTRRWDGAGHCHACGRAYRQGAVRP